MATYSCPYLGQDVELTDERAAHIVQHHPDLLPKYQQKIATVLADPDQIRQSLRFGRARMFTRWFDDLRGGKHVVVVVVSDSLPPERHWIITAYIARRLSKEGYVEWEKH